MYLRHAFPIMVLTCILGIPGVWVTHAASRPSDEAISFWVREALFKDPRSAAADITVSTNDGIVTLAGSVPTLNARQDADLEAKKIAGVRGVLNDLFVTPAFRFDADITQDIRKRLVNSVSITSEALGVTVNQGKVTLTGTVTSWPEKEEAEQLTGAVSGVKDANNMLRVQYPNVRTDAEILRDVSATLARDAYLTGLSITASVKNGVATLEGEVGTAYQKERAGKAARLVRNVVGVTNDLKVAWWESMGTRQKKPAPTDVQLTTIVREALAADQRLASSDVTVQVQQGVVTLYGRVPSLYQKRLATQTTQDVVGVVWVTNHLTASTSHRNDADIEGDVRQQLATDALLPSGRLDVKSHNGIVTLTGSVNTMFQKLYATDAAARVKGIRSIVNDMTVRAAWDTDAALTRRIQDFLATNAELQWAVKQIHVAVDQGVVTLTGTVNFWSERQAAGQVAFETEGVRSVDNQLVVTNPDNPR